MHLFRAKAHWFLLMEKPIILDDFTVVYFTASDAVYESFHCSPMGKDANSTEVQKDPLPILLIGPFHPIPISPAIISLFAAFSSLSLFISLMPLYLCIII